MSGELITIDQYCKLEKTSLSFKREVNQDEWMHVFKALKTVEGCVQFWIGDCLAYRQQRWGMYDDIAEETGYEKETLKKYKKVSEGIETGLRRPELSFSHHEQVAFIEPEKQEIFLQKAVDEKLSVRDLREEIKKDKWSSLKAPEFPSGKYRVIYADPPWQYTSGNQHSNEEQKTVLSTYYNSMSIDELCNLPVKELAQDNAVLFLWVTSPLLDECFSIIDAWGFEYKASIVWDKDAHNVGHYVSVRHEFLLICTRGSCLPDVNKLHPSVVTEKRTEHSVKPEKFREIINSMYPLGQRVELFARRRAEGWDAWGNQL